MSKWLKRRSSKSRSSRTSSNRRKSSSSHEKGMVSYQQGSRFRALSLWGCVCKDWETKKMVIVQSSFWSSFWAAFHFRIFEVCSCSAWYLLLLAHNFWMLLEAWFHADINLLDECLQIQNQANMYIKSHRFLCHPYRSWEFHDHIKYQCPGVTVPNGRRFWRALIYCSVYITQNDITIKNLSVSPIPSTATITELPESEWIKTLKRRSFTWIQPTYPPIWISHHFFLSCLLPKKHNSTGSGVFFLGFPHPQQPNPNGQKRATGEPTKLVCQLAVAWDFLRRTHRWLWWKVEILLSSQLVSS